MEDDCVSAGSLSVNVTLVRRFKLLLGVGHKFQMDRYLETPPSMGLFLWCGSLFPCKKIKIGCGKMWQAARPGFSCFWISWKSLATVEKEDAYCYKDCIQARNQHGSATEPPGPSFKEVVASPLVRFFSSQKKTPRLPLGFEIIASLWIKSPTQWTLLTVWHYYFWRCQLSRWVAVRNQDSHKEESKKNSSFYLRTSPPVINV